MSTKEFQDVLWQYYQDHGRDLPWRIPQADGSFDPYHILVSEIMLQQTQVERVIPKYNTFISKLPSIHILAKAKLGTVLTHWSGLGYNRRAKFLHESAKKIHGLGSFPSTIESLTGLPGIGVNTAGAILVYSYNKPEIFIETNIRTVIIHHYFPDKQEVSDTEIRTILQDVINHENPRGFYWAMMDYGTYLKKQGISTARKSKHYTKQPTFQGSERQLRGNIIRKLTEKDSYKISILIRELNDIRSEGVLEQLGNEQLVVINGNRVSLP